MREKSLRYMTLREKTLRDKTLREKTLREKTIPAHVIAAAHSLQALGLLLVTDMVGPLLAASTLGNLVAAVATSSLATNQTQSRTSRHSQLRLQPHATGAAFSEKNLSGHESL